VKQNVRSLRVASPPNFARPCVCISPAPQSLSPKLETSRSLLFFSKSTVTIRPCTHVVTFALVRNNRVLSLSDLACHNCMRPPPFTYGAFVNPVFQYWRVERCIYCLVSSYRYLPVSSIFNVKPLVISSHTNAVSDSHCFVTPTPLSDHLL